MEENIRAAKIVISNKRERLFPCFVCCCGVENDLNRTVCLRYSTFAFVLHVSETHQHTADIILCAQDFVIRLNCYIAIFS